MKYQRIAGMIFLITVFLVTNSKGMAMAENPYSYYRKKLKEVNVSDGVNKEEAIIIAQNYVVDKIQEGEDFYKKLGISKPEFSEDPKYVDRFPEEWVILFPMRFGLLKTWDVIYVNKLTGEVTAGGPIK